LGNNVCYVAQSAMFLAIHFYSVSHRHHHPRLFAVPKIEGLRSAVPLRVWAYWVLEAVEGRDGQVPYLHQHSGSLLKNLRGWHDSIDYWHCVGRETSFGHRFVRSTARFVHQQEQSEHEAQGHQGQMVQVELSLASLGRLK